MPVFKSTRLLDQLREQIRYLHYSLRTEEAYVYWVKNFIRFHGLKHPRDMGQAEIESFLTSLALTETDPPVLTGIDPVTMAGDGGMRR